MKSLKQLLFVWHEKDKATVELVSTDFVEGAKGLVLGGEKMWKVFRVFLWVWKGTNKIVPKSMSRLQYLKTLKTNYKPNEQNTQTHLKNTQNQKTKLLNTLWRTTQNQFKAIKKRDWNFVVSFSCFRSRGVSGFFCLVDWLFGYLVFKPEPQNPQPLLNMRVKTYLKTHQTINNNEWKPFQNK